MAKVVMTALLPDKQEVLRYLGYGNALPDTRTDSLIEACRAQTVALVQPRGVLQTFEILPPSAGDASGIRLKGTTLFLAGEDIVRHLAGCKSCVLLAATLGLQIEQALRAAQLNDMPRAVILDSCATAAVEQVCDALCTQICTQAAAQGRGTTSRFSPGYGDLPIETQRAFAATLDTGRQIGLMVTSTNILTPRKSVTAIVGLSQEASSGGAECKSGENCAACRQNNNCLFRRLS